MTKPIHRSTKDVVAESMQRHIDYCESHPMRPIALDGHVPTDEQRATAQQLNEIERRANALRLERYEAYGLISSIGAW